jgi:hypothetical protein
VDDSRDADGSRRVTGAAALGILSGKGPAPSVPPPPRGQAVRYFGQGDVLRNATLEFGEGIKVQIDSRFEQCSIALGRGAELTVGKAGVLAHCRIEGSGNITLHGRFFERESPGIIGPSQLVVTSEGELVGQVEQAPHLTRFGFEPGCRLRMKILKSRIEPDSIPVSIVPGPASLPKIPDSGGGPRDTPVSEPGTNKEQA